ncbi:MAG TPA: glycosyltransferase family 9 protein [Bacteroidota bacterium]|jgi:ADP-heptose:LPS heptosyltransferase|nr:glycosyltransferase family 9 protein [Bacteroidota bacterium]
MLPINRILISRMKYIGDIVLTTPVIRAVREKYPEAYIAYLGDKRAVSLLEHNPYLDEIIPFDFSKPDIFEQPRVAFLLRKRKFDVFIDLFSNPRTAMLAWASRAPIRIGKDVKGRGRLYTHRIGDYGALKPAIEFHYQYVLPIGVGMTHFKTEIFLTDDEKREARIFLKHQDVDVAKPIVAIHIGASWPNKVWLKENFVELIDAVRAKLGAEIIVSYGPGDEELVGDIMEHAFGKVSQLPLLPLRQLAAILSLSNVFVSNDCGPMHIGVAVGTPTIGIFGPEPPEVWFNYAREDGHTALFRKIECSPCRTTKCFREGEHFMECMKLITVTQVYEEVRRRLVAGSS